MFKGGTIRRLNKRRAFDLETGFYFGQTLPVMLICSVLGCCVCSIGHGPDGVVILETAVLGSLRDLLISSSSSLPYWSTPKP